MIVIPVAVRFATHDSCPQIGLFGLSHEKCSDDFSSKSLIALIATIDSAQVGLAVSLPGGIESGFRVTDP